jgi:molybdopterin converting factor small subunit
MKIVVKLGAPLSQVVGESKLILAMPDGVSIADVLEEVRARHPDFEEGLRGKGLRKPFDQVLYSLFLNARPVPLEQAASTSLRDGDRIYLFLPVSGG